MAEIAISCQFYTQESNQLQNTGQRNSRCGNVAEFLDAKFKDVIHQVNVLFGSY